MKKINFTLGILAILILAVSCDKTESPLPPEIIIDKSPYINKVFEYKRAPGQHANTITDNPDGNWFIGKPWENGKSFTSLGGWGGYIIAGFEHPVENIEGPDFAVYTQPGAGSEPGVVFVMKDSNKNGIPDDDEWIELKGSEDSDPETIKNYSATYFKPADEGNVTWSDNRGNSGELIPEYESTSWWPSEYQDLSEIVFSGTKLPDSHYNSNPGGTGEANWIKREGLFTWGYAECYNNNDYDTELKANKLDISNAIDSRGNAVELGEIDFIKVQSGVFQLAGWLNEVSTEVSGAANLSLLN